jgi:GTPase SAR1 family protein
MHHSTELEIGVVQWTSGDNSVDLELWDTGGDSNYAAFRLQCYPDSHLVVICFAIDSPDSLDNAKELVLLSYTPFVTFGTN